MREINVVYISSEDPGFEGDALKAEVIAPNTILSYTDERDWAFRVLDEEISEQQEELVVDLDKCASVFITLQSTEKISVSVEFLENASFVEVIQLLAGKIKWPEDAGTSMDR